MTEQEANELLVKSIEEFDLKNLKLAYENGADINYNPSSIFLKDKNGNAYSVATDDTVLANALWSLGMKIVEAESDEVRQDLEDKAFPVVKFCVDHGIWLNTHYISHDDCIETQFAISNYVSCNSEKILSYLLENGLNPNTHIDGIYTICDDLYDTAHYDEKEIPEWAPYEFKMLEVLRKYGGKYSEEILEKEQ